MKYTLMTLWMLCCSMSMALAQADEDVKIYIERYKQLAIEEQMRIGVPAAITLAQGIHESSAGKSLLAVNGNNHFGIKCKSTWTGDTILHDDDRKQECFRKYISAEQSYIDHSDFLKGSNRYSFLFDLEITDYIGWASGLKRAGYATNPLYVRKLTDLVEKYNLQQFTYEALRKKMSTPTGEIIPEKDNTSANFTQAEDPSTSYKGLRGFWAKKGESLVDKAVMNNIRYQRLLELNDLPDAPLEQDMFLFLEKKRKTGTVEFHTVKEGENMQFISQKEAISLQNLYAFNNMETGQEAETGEQLTLQYKSYGTPKLKPGFPPKKEEPLASAPVDTMAAQATATAGTEAKTEVPKPVEPEVAKATKPSHTEAPKEVTPTPVEEKKETPQTPPPATTKTETKTVSNPAILDLEKARRTEALLGKGVVEEKIVVKAETVPAETKVEQAAPPVPAPEAPKPAPVKKERPPAPKRTYNEVGVSDSVKTLKEKFDQIVYRPLPERKKPEPVVPAAKPETKPAAAPAKTTTPPTDAKAKKTGEAKPAEAKKTDEKQDSKTIDGKTAKVEKTNTGIVREMKKDSVKTPDKKATDKPGAKKPADKKASDKKEVAKKPADKKASAAKPADKKKASDKKPAAKTKK